MVREYTDEVAWVLDMAAESMSNERCTGLTPSDKLYEAWSAWQEAIAKLLLGWGDRNGLGDGVARLLQSERYFAWDVLATLQGHGVGVGDGRWDQYLGRENRKDVEDYLKQHLRRDFAAIETAIENDAYAQCKDDGDDTAAMFDGVSSQTVASRPVRLSRAGRLPSWTRPRR
jgi:hypothetical protein